MTSRAVFRIDDVSLNTDPTRLQEMVGALRTRVPGCFIIGAVSPCVHRLPNGSERVFPSLLNVESDFRVFYRPDRVGIPERLLEHFDEISSHGMVHVDHRLLDRSAQELSIVLSCALVRSDSFVPPFHKWDADTESVCQEHRIRLVKREPSMVHLKYHRYDGPRYYYLHTHDFPSMADFTAQLP